MNALPSQGGRNTRVASRVGLLGAGLLGVALGLVTALAWSKLSHVNLEMENVASDLVPQQQRLALIELNVTRSSLQVRHALLVRTPADLASTLVS